MAAVGALYSAAMQARTAPARSIQGTFAQPPRQIEQRLAQGIESVLAQELGPLALDLLDGLAHQLAGGAPALGEPDHARQALVAVGPAQVVARLQAGQQVVHRLAAHRTGAGQLARALAVGAGIHHHGQLGGREVVAVLVQRLEHALHHHLPREAQQRTDQRPAEARLGLLAPCA